LISRRFNYLIVSLLILAVISGCSTTKNTFTRRVYHNLTAHYNAYWNGNESFKEGVTFLSKNSKDNYAQVLPVYPFGTYDEAQKIVPQMDRAIEKGAKVIKLHSIYIKGKEYVNWIDDAYLLIGKANHYKQDYRTALRTFNFIINQYKNNPIKYDAMIWLALSSIQVNEYVAAQSNLDQVNNKINLGKAPKYLLRDFNTAYAHFYVKQENYTPAIDYLIPAIKLNKKKDTKTRLRFILAQIYQLNGDLAKASENYQLVIKKNPPYEMAFNAKINLAMCYDAATGDRKALEKRLNKMLKDQKNKEYLDQIYYALAEVALRNKDYIKAISYLKLSVSSSQGNNYQKAISALKLADLYFDRAEYENAQAYYDSTIMFLPKTYEKWDLIKSKADVLTELVKNINTVKVEDSLQYMAKLKPSERDMIINNTIAAILKEEQLKAEEENSNRMALNVLQSGNQNKVGNQGNAGEWYFYNTSAMSFGFTEFKKKWGKRKLEDLWRISNKQTFEFSEDIKNKEKQSIDPNDTLAAITNPKNKNFYLKNLPLTEEKMKVSNEKIQEALYNMGFIYYEGLKDFNKAISAFDTLLYRYPNGIKTASAYYQLYRIYIDLENKSKRDYFKNLIIKEYPESDYAKILSDPEYYKQLQKKKNESNTLYEETYQAFLNNNYNKVLSNFVIASDKYSTSSVFPKFSYLESLSKGKIYGKDSLVISLQRFINTFKTHEIVPIAQAVIDFINKGNEIDLVANTSAISNIESNKQKKSNSKKEEQQSKVENISKEQDKTSQTITKNSIDTNIVKSSEQKKITNSIYRFDGKATHYFIMLVDASKVNINALKVKISDFNRKHFASNNLTITSVIYNQNTHIISVEHFLNANEALAYYKNITSDSYIFSNLNSDNSTSFIITTENFSNFYKIKDLDGYKSFFESAYLSQ